MSYVCLTVEEDCKSRSSIKRRSSSSKFRCSSAHFSSSTAHLRIAAYRSRIASSVRSLSARSRSRLSRAAASSSDSDASRSPAIVPNSGDEMGRLSLPAPSPVEGGYRNAIGLGFGWIQTDGMKSKFFGWRGIRRGGAAASAGDCMGDRFGPGSKREGFEFEGKAKVGNGYLLIVIVMVITTVIRRVILIEEQAFEQTLIPASWLDKKRRGPHRGLLVGPSNEYRPCELARTGASELPRTFNRQSSQVPEVGPVDILELRGGLEKKVGPASDLLVAEAKVPGRAN